MTGPLGVGVIGAGFISGIYLKNLTTRWPHVRVKGVADLVPEKASARAAEFGVPALSIDALLADPAIDIVLNLTIPAAHGIVARQVIDAGKSVYNEKPLTLDRDGARTLLADAGNRGLRVGCAPDTFLGAGLQTARRVLDEGMIGEPIAFRAKMITHGHESWHPEPAFYYQPGAGPMLDMGPYYITALVTLLGPVVRAGGHTGISFPERMITSAPHHGEMFQVTTPSHVETVLQLESGAIGSVLTTFDEWDPVHSWLRIYGTEGTLALPDPNTFGGPLMVLRDRSTVWEPIPLDDGYPEDTRGLGVADLAAAIREERPARASGELGYHVLDVMLAALEAGEHIRITSRADRPEPLRSGDLQRW